jgi:hypothetical protein
LGVGQNRHIEQVFRHGLEALKERVELRLEEYRDGAVLVSVSGPAQQPIYHA